MSEDFKSVCDVCGRKTWYEGNEQCHCSYPKQKTCRTCGHSEVIHPETWERCKGTLRPIDNSDLNTDFTPYLHTGQRVEIKFSYGETKRGYIGKTTGWKPAYILLLTSRSRGSSYVIGKEDRLTKVVNK